MTSDTGRAATGAPLPATTDATTDGTTGAAASRAAATVPGATEACLSFQVRHAWLSMRSVIATALATHDLSVAQYASLLKLAEEPGLSPAGIARGMASTRQAANQMLTGLERAGLIERAPHPRDRRSQRVFLTEAGVERLRAAAPAVAAAEQVLEADVPAADRAVVRAWLTRMARASSPSVEEIPTA
jgi:DNA-binding MarR family transcriptional regulator